MADEKPKYEGVSDDIKSSLQDMQDSQDDVDPVLNAKLKVKYEQYKKDVQKMGARGSGIAKFDQYQQIQHILAHEKTLSNQKMAEKRPQQQPQQQQQPGRGIQIPEGTVNAGHGQSDQLRYGN
jgi:hypothetical protein